MTTTFEANYGLEWVTDPSHGWLKVPYRRLADVGMGVSDFSPYSYWSAKHQNVYLEEDCDAPKFLARWRAMGRDHAIPEGKDYPSVAANPIRRMERIRERD